MLIKLLIVRIECITLRLVEYMTYFKVTLLAVKDMLYSETFDILIKDRCVGYYNLIR